MHEGSTLWLLSLAEPRPMVCSHRLAIPDMDHFLVKAHIPPKDPMIKT